MAVIVKIPTVLRGAAGGKASLAGRGRTVGEVVDHLDSQCAGFRERVCDEDGIRKAVSIFLNGEDVRFLAGLDTPVKDGDEMSIVPALAGG